MAKKKVIKPTKEELPPKKPVLKPKPPIEEPKPVPEKKVPDFDIKLEDGNLSDTHSICRCFMVDESGKEIPMLDEEFVSSGFGQSRGEAVQDFIRRNNSNILSKIFERSQE